MKANLGEFEEIVLLLVAGQHDQAYGLSITEAIENELGRSVTLSSVHTALYRLEDKGFVESRLGGASPTRGGRRKRLYIITGPGKAALKKTMAARVKLWQMIPDFVIEGAH